MQRIEDYLRQAESNVRKAEDNHKLGYYDLASFLSQQAAELSLKGALQRKKLNRKTHDLEKLIGTLDEPIPEEIVKSAKELDIHYIASRYPNSFDSGSPITHYTDRTSLQAIENARKVLEWVKSYVRK